MARAAKLITGLSIWLILSQCVGKHAYQYECSLYSNGALTKDALPDHTNELSWDLAKVKCDSIKKAKGADSCKLEITTRSIPL